MYQLPDFCTLSAYAHSSYELVVCYHYPCFIVMRVSIACFLMTIVQNHTGNFLLIQNVQYAPRHLLRSTLPILYGYEHDWLAYNLKHVPANAC